VSTDRIRVSPGTYRDSLLLLSATRAMQAGYPVRVIALGDPAVGFFRPVRVPCTIIPAPPTLPTLEERVFASVGALAAGLAPLAGASGAGPSAGRRRPDRTAAPTQQGEPECVVGLGDHCQNVSAHLGRHGVREAGIAHR
jgi:hypothetical protein